MTEFCFPFKDVKVVNIAEARRLFEQANHFWFEEGCYYQLLPLYLEALKNPLSSFFKLLHQQPALLLLTFYGDPKCSSSFHDRKLYLVSIHH